MCDLQRQSAEAEKEDALSREKAGKTDAATRKKEVSVLNQKRLAAMRKYSEMQQNERLLTQEASSNVPISPDFTERWATKVLAYFTGNSYQKHHKRKQSARSNFKRDVISYYNSEQPDNEKRPEEERSYWCPIYQKWYLRDDMKAALIVPCAVAVPQVLIDEVCGMGTSTWSMSPWNGLYIHKELEKAFDNGQIFIVLVEGTTDEC